MGKQNTKNLSKDNFNITEPNNSQEILVLRNSKYGTSSVGLVEGKGFVGNKLQKSKVEEVKSKIKNIDSRKVKTVDHSMELTNVKLII